MIYVVSWNYYIPGCPADLEVTDFELIGITTTKDYAEAFINRYIRQTCEVDDRVLLSREEYQEEYDGYFDIQEEELDTYLVKRLKLIKEIQDARLKESNVRQ